MTEREAVSGIVEEFRCHLVADGKSPATVESYVGDVAGFVAFLESRGLTFTGDMRRSHVTAYRRHLVECDHEVATVNKKVNSLQSFNQFLLGRGLTRERAVDVKRDKVKVATGSEGDVEVFSEAEVEKITFHAQDPARVKRNESGDGS